MFHFYCFLFLLLAGIACSSPTPKEEEPPLPLPIIQPMDSISTKDTLSAPLSSNLDSLLPCTCKKRTYKRSPRTQLTFRAYDQEKNPQKIEEWKENHKLQEIHSLRLMSFDTIPKELEVFTAVTKVVLVNSKGTEGLDIFPNLEEVHFFGGRLSGNFKGQWTKRVKILAAQKTVFKQLTSFNTFPNLEIIDFAFSGFQPFPTDLEQLTCLQELYFNAYINGSKDDPLDLSQFNLMLFPCLREAHFQSWQNALTSIPQNTLSAQLEQVEVHHGNLTEEEHLELKDVKNILFDRRVF